MKKKFFLSSSVILLFSCTSSKINNNDWNSLIEGRWRLTIKYQTNYPTIEFTKGGAVFNSLADTIYGFSCTLKKSDLILFDGVNPKKHNRIIKLTKDSLIFENLLEYKTPQVYIRESQK
jgi:hypothetical protein